MSHPSAVENEVHATVRAGFFFGYFYFSGGGNSRSGARAAMR